MILDLTNKIYNKVLDQGIYKSIYFAFFSYILPILFLFLFLFDQFTFESTEMFFWMLFLTSLIPCGIIGIIACAFALFYAFKADSKINKIISALGIIVGFCGITGGVLAVLLIYIVIS